MTNAYYANDIIASLTQGTNSQSYRPPPNRPVHGGSANTYDYANQDSLNT